MATGIKPGDRVLVRERPWKVKSINDCQTTQALVELEALDDDFRPRFLTIITPPEEVVLLPNQEVTFDLRAFDSYSAWSWAHRILGASLCRDSGPGILSGARYGRVNIEAYQIAPTLRVLSKIRPSLLIADDVGLGKTIEAGLAMLELIARKRVKRILIVTPAGLIDQWYDEILDKFGLEFKIIGNATEFAKVQAELPAGVNPWDGFDRIITSIDFLKKETIRKRALKKKWDLVIVDEAHALAEAGTPGNPYKTQRTRLGIELQKNSRGLLLLTATPHNGYSHSFRSLIELIDPALASFCGSKEDVERRIEAARIRRMKSQIRRRLPDGTEVPLFPKRSVSGIPIVDLTDSEKELLRKVASYCSKTARQAEDQEDSELIGFAMQIIKKRALSSKEAVKNTLNHRLEALTKEELKEEPPSPHEFRDLKADLPISDSEAERVARKIIRSAIPADEKRRQDEIRAIRKILRLMNQLPPRDPKVEQLMVELNYIFSEDSKEKVIIFTEYRDTLNAIKARLDSDPNYMGKYVIFHGGLSRRQRLAREMEFEKPEVRILLTTDAASEGLNLQRYCRRIIHFELPWNPNRLEQRNGRIDRYGQTREPIIKYLYYPDSPEDDVLNRLVRKIEEMAKQRLSTPDILGILSGRGKIQEELTRLDPESPEADQKKNNLIVVFEDKTKDFVNECGYLLTLSDSVSGENNKIYQLLNSSYPLLPDDIELEESVIGILGKNNVKECNNDAHIYRLEVPIEFRGEKVRAVYPAATFRRSVATKYKPDEVEYITPLHPLVVAISQEIRRRFIQVYTTKINLVPRRLAAIGINANEPPSILFTFYSFVKDGDGNLEEHILGIRITKDGNVLGDPIDNLKFIKINNYSDIDLNILENLFAENFDKLRELALQECKKWLEQRKQQLIQQRKQIAEKMINEIEKDIGDRLKELDEEEKRARKLIEDTGQQRLFSELESTRAKSYVSRKNVLISLKNERIEEIKRFMHVNEPGIPFSIGALFLIPVGGER